MAAQNPDKILKEKVDPLVGFQPFQGRRLAYALNLDPKLVRGASQIMVDLYRMFVENDCSLAEINPLAVTADGRIIALDAKLSFDDDALFRNPELGDMRDSSQDDPFEVQAREYGVSYVKLDGEVGCLVNGAGLAMATMDVIQYSGSKPANFLDVGGMANEQRIAQAFGIMLSDPGVTQILVNVFGGILRCDIVARGIVAAYGEKGAKVPLLVRMQGTNMEEGREILRASELNATFADSLADVAQVMSEGLRR